jgi:diguanylate cyclase (GGDEF)-like protein/PAS domain S-box-containing protein
MPILPDNSTIIGVLSRVYRSRSLRPYMAIVGGAVAAGSLVLLFELLKMAIRPRIGAWSSHFSTAIFISFIAAGIIVVVFRLKTLWDKTAQLELSRLAALVRCSDYAILSSSISGTIETWNLGAERIFGYPATEAIGQSISILAPAGRFSEQNQILEMVAHGTDHEIETSRRTKDGREITVLLTISPIRGAESEIIGIATIARDVTARKQSEESFIRSQVQYRLLFDSNPIPMWVFDRDTLRFLAVNRSAIRQYGFTEEEFLRMTIAEIRPPEYVSEMLSDVAKRTRGLQKPGAWKHRKKDGAILDVEVVCHDLDFQGFEAMLVAAYDVTEQHRSRETILFKTALLEAESETTIDGILAVDERDRIVLINKQFALQFDVPDEILNSGDDLLLRNYSLARIENPGTFLERIRYFNEHPDEKSRDEIRLKNGRTFDRYSAPLIDSKGQHRGRIWYHRDITERKAAEAQVQFLAYFDALTSLPNRTLLKDRLSNAVAGLQRRNEKVAVLFLDLDRFKIINDSLGHSIGDQMLQVVAERLKECVRDQDTVARVGGDEFIVVLSGVKEPADAAVIADRIVNGMTDRFIIDGHSLSTSCSVGISMAPEDSFDCETLIKYADQAMYSAKETGRNTYRFFTKDLNVEAVERLHLENQLHQALQRGEFYLVYQPQIEIVSGQLTGVEALIRWKNDELGSVSPDEFIAIAENSGLILPLGKWVLRTACSQVRTWQTAGLNVVPVAINVSAVQFRQSGFSEEVREVLIKTGLPPKYLELELTESVLLSNADLTCSVLNEFLEMGVKLAIDDFGTGYSNLSYLKRFRANRLKIDRSFIRDLKVDSDDAAIIAAIIGMAKALHITVVAEGVETMEQMSFLRNHDCNEIQGFLYSEPLSTDDMTELLTTRSEWPAVIMGQFHSVESRST